MTPTSTIGRPRKKRVKLEAMFTVLTIILNLTEGVRRDSVVHRQLGLPDALLLLLLMAILLQLLPSSALTIFS